MRERSDILKEYGQDSPEFRARLTEDTLDDLYERRAQIDEHIRIAGDTLDECKQEMRRA